MAIQILDENRKKSFGEKLNIGIGDALRTGMSLYEKHQERETAQRNLQQKMQHELEKEQKKSDLKSEIETAKSKAAHDTAIEVESLKQGKRTATETSKQKEKEDKIASNKTQLADLEKRRGLEPGALDAYVDDVKAAEKITRPDKEPKKTQASQPIDPEQLAIIKRVRSDPEYQDASSLKKYQILTDNNVSKENAQAEADIAGKQEQLNLNKFEKSYDSQKEFINDTTRTYKAFETETKPRLMQMQKIVSDEELISPTSNVFLEALGIPLGALEDPSSELYNKVSLDLLKGLPETYGNKIMKVEVDNFLKTIPSLMNSASGRRMIASNMLKLGEMKEVYYNEMRRQQKQAEEKGQYPRDFQQEVFDHVRPQIDRINNEFVKLSEIKSVPKDTIPFFAPDGQIKFIPKQHAQWAQEQGGKRIW